MESAPELQKFLRFLQSLTFCGSMFALCKDTFYHLNCQFPCEREKGEKEEFDNVEIVRLVMVT